MRFPAFILVLTAAAAVFGQWQVAPADLPPPASPLRLLDLRHLAREARADGFIVDTWNAPAANPEQTGKLYTLADIAGRGVASHLMMAAGPRWVVEIDGKTVYDGVPAKDWRDEHRVKQDGPGDAPWTYPLAQLSAGNVAESILPLPFGERLIVRCEQPKAELWLAGSYLPEAPARTFGDEQYLAEVASVVKRWGAQFNAAQVPLPPDRFLIGEATVGPGERATVLELADGGEITGIHFTLDPAFTNRLRHLVVEITPDGAAEPSLRMGMMDLLGFMQPQLLRWTWRYGNAASAFAFPTWHGRAATGHWRLPIPFGDGLKIAVVNRHPALPMQVQARVRVSPLPAPDRALRLCGTVRALDLPKARGQAVTLAEFPAAGRLAALHVATVGHDKLWTDPAAWRDHQHLALLGPDDTVIAAGHGFLPLANRFSNSPNRFGPTWGQTMLDFGGRASCARSFHAEQLVLPPRSRIEYRAGGELGPDRAQVALFWYQAQPYAAPPLPPEPEPAPVLTRTHPPLEEPGGWFAEAENLIDRVETTGGEVYVARDLALEAWASRNAVLAWSPPAPGHAFDLLLPTPPARYVKVWLRPLRLPGGGRFPVRLLPATQTEVRPLFKLGDTDFLARVLGRIESPYTVDCYNSFPIDIRWGNVPSQYLLNPAPGELCRLRLIATPSVGGDLFLMLDQVVLNPAPPTPAPWRPIEAAVVARRDAGVRAELMPYGRGDFHGAGGIEVATGSPGGASLRLFDLLPPVAAGHLELRLAVPRGAWELTIGDHQAVTVNSKDHGKVTVVALGQAAMDGVADIELRVRCTDLRGGELALDSWRLVDPDAPATPAKETE